MGLNQAVIDLENQSVSQHKAYVYVESVQLWKSLEQDVRVTRSPWYMSDLEKECTQQRMEGVWLVGDQP